jgi:hypothetical protein
MRRILCVAGGLLLATQSVCAGVVDAINEDAAPSTSDWAASEVGWFYTPAFDYVLSGVETKFRSTDGRSVAVQVFQNFVPGVGGTLLRSGFFGPVANAFSGASFADLALLSTEEYFVAFVDTSGIGVNYTAEDDATVLGQVHFSLTPGEKFSHFQNGDAEQPILRFLGPANTIAEPATLLLLGLGLVSLGLARVRPRLLL